MAYLMAILWGVLMLTYGSAFGAELHLRMLGGGERANVQIGQVFEVEIIAVPGRDEALAGLTFFMAFDARVFAPQAPSGQQPFTPGEWLEGVPLLNNWQQREDTVWMGYAEAGGTTRAAVSSEGVVARTALKVVGKPSGGSASIVLEERNLDWSTHYLSAASPGVELAFALPLGHLVLAVEGFDFSALPPVQLVEGERQVVFDLDDFLPQGIGPVLWTASRAPGVEVGIDGDHQVELAIAPGQVGSRQVVFTALAVDEGLTARDTLALLLLSPPKIQPIGVVRFEEDGQSDLISLDQLATDQDGDLRDITWAVEGGQQVIPVLDRALAQLHFAVAADWSGQEQITLLARDVDDLADTVIVEVIVDPVNDAPQALMHPVLYFRTGQPPRQVPITDLVRDVDNSPESLTLELALEGQIAAVVSPSFLSVEGLAAGRGLVRYKVADRGGQQALGRLVVMVLDEVENRPPFWRLVSPLQLAPAERAQFDLALWVADDGQTQDLVFSVLGESQLPVELAGSLLAISPAAGFVGTSEIHLQVQDAEGAQDQLVLAVEVAAGDEVLRLRLPTLLGAVAGSPSQFDPAEWLSASAGLVLNWDFSTAQDLGARFVAETQRLILEPTPEAIGPAMLEVEVTAADGLKALDSLQVLVAAPGGAPQVAPLSEITIAGLADTVELNLGHLAVDDLDRTDELQFFADPEPDLGALVEPIEQRLLLFRRAGVKTGAEVSHVVLRVQDTDGLEGSGLLKVRLPPLFEVVPLPRLVMFADQVDSSLVLGQFVQVLQDGLDVQWQAEPGDHIAVEIDPRTSRAYVQVRNPDFEGLDQVLLTARGETGRVRQLALEVQVKGRGLVPQITPFPVLELGENGEHQLNLDEFVVDDNADSSLSWSVGRSENIAATIDVEQRLLTIAGGGQPGRYLLQIVVRDPAGNSAVGALEVIVVRGGSPPVLASLPRLLLAAGAPEDLLHLSPYAEDRDGEGELLQWSVSAEPGVAARMQQDLLYVSVPAGQSGTRRLKIRVTDAQGNWDEGELVVFIIEDDQAPELSISARRHPVLNDVIEIHLVSNEPLGGLPTLVVGSQAVEMEALREGYLASYVVPEGSGELLIRAGGADPAGNKAEGLLRLAYRWMNERGGQLASPDGGMVLDVPDGAAGVGRLALVYRLDPAQYPRPFVSGGRKTRSAQGPVYRVELSRGRQLAVPVGLQVKGGNTATDGMLRWDSSEEDWQPLSAVVDLDSGWLLVSTDHLGLFRVGPVDSKYRIQTPSVTNYPNPLTLTGGGTTQIVYRLALSGPVRLRVFNTLGQTVRVLLDGDFREAGMWSAVWDGRDAYGQVVGNGVYFYEVQGGGPLRRGSMLLLR